VYKKLHNALRDVGNIKHVYAVVENAVEMTARFIII